MRLRRIAGALTALVLAAAPASPAAAQGAYPPGVTADTLRIAAAGPAQVAAGGAHSCVTTSVGDVYCWGDDSSGQLGDGSRAHEPGRPVLAMHDAVQLDAGRAHTCGISADGVAYCWGDDSAGQLGDGGNTDREAPEPVRALAGRTLVEIATGARHTCVIDDEGSVWCWGDGSRGQLGVPGTTGTATPVRVPMTGPVVDIAAGGDSTCAATAGGVAYCWGRDGDEPAALRTGDKVRQVAVGGGAGPCVLDADGVATCWAPRATTIGPLTAISAGGQQTCGIDRGRRASCWDRGGRSPLDGGPVVAIDAGADHACAIDDQGYTSCWGAGHDGQLGTRTTSLSAVPVRVEGLPRPPAAATGIRVRALDGGLRVSWRPPADLGSGRFEYLWATTAGHESGCTLRAAAATGCELRNLHNGQDYDVAVVVKTSDGVTVSDFVTAAPSAVAPEPSGAVHALPRELQPGADGGLPVTGLSPVALVSIGTMLLGGGLVALLVRKPSPPAPRRGTARHRP
ncbi:hypothetical protein AB0J80_36495 [Actinoplanes sp. NPDC049548]|uniref:RCC1 domain-containing protein n=1 Tax=Actinoplanes sp. NPDC049548 TaxID=3155152 RepID=UPI0034268C42